MNKKTLSISLVIPAHNEELQLAACLDSVAAQTVMPDEVIVVDNNSTDATAKLTQKYPFVKLVQESQQGVIFARNRGFNEAQSDIIGRIDADTVLPPDWVEHILDFFGNSANEHMAWTGGGHFYNVRFPRAVSWFYNLMCFRFNSILNGYPTLWGSNMALPRPEWQRINSHICIRTDIHEDLDLAIHLYQADCEIFYDTTIKTRTQLRRVHSNRHELWEYLQWWPRTLRVHGRWNWVLCWIIGCLFLYCLTPLLLIAEKLARLAGRRPLSEHAS